MAQTHSAYTPKPPKIHPPFQWQAVLARKKAHKSKSSRAVRRGINHDDSIGHNSIVLIIKTHASKQAKPVS
eukprot:4954900-Amphidinium_carterae.1